MYNNNFFDFLILFFLQYVPNAMIYILAGYAFNKSKINIKKYLVSSIMLAFFGLTAKLLSETKLLNTSNTVPQILILFACIFLLVKVNKIKVVKAILSSLSVMIVQIVFEGIYILLVLKSFFNLEAQHIFEKSILNQSLIGLPTQMILAIIIYILYKFMTKRKGTQ